MMSIHLAFVACFAVVVYANQELWDQFKIKHGKSYSTEAEEKRRYEIFKSNLKSIEDHNAKYERGEVTWFQAPNHMSDWTFEEFENTLRTKPLTNTADGKVHILSGKQLPKSIDWRDSGIVTEVQNQGYKCGSCWSFSVAGTLEGLYAQKTGNLLQLSEQNLIDCATPDNGYNCNGCSGGIPSEALQYVVDNGIDYFSEYPYEGEQKECRQKNKILQISSYTNTVPNDESSLQDAVATVGPVSVSLNGSLAMHYSGGIFQDEKCEKGVNHGVLAVGYGEENGQKYWIFKNSYGTDWGIKGYMKIVMGSNMCGLASQPCYPNL
ncbi:procathepsin L-like [Anthonomus grandis grandis]|uniref:procathepsin L-like n=1 Tax=Anthonomus grandis grandis TaxID=2921223 RepID=UPI00216674CF|nr:procathepsin L-like [Anthonomus grandis grandis]XP_050302732.1 procathepsin L-like [Anthonomus grandis grandis]